VIEDEGEEIWWLAHTGFQELDCLHPNPHCPQPSQPLQRGLGLTQAANADEHFHKCLISQAQPLHSGTPETQDWGASNFMALQHKRHLTRMICCINKSQSS
jgi:hypothetical protein